MYRIQLDPGPWQQYIKRADNIGLPLHEVSKKYMMESNLYATQLFEATQQSPVAIAGPASGGGSATEQIQGPTSTPTPTPTSTPTPTPTPTPLPFTSSIAINLCAPTSSYNNMVIYAYAVTGSTPKAVNTGVTTGFYWSGSSGGLLSGSLTIPSGSTCTSASFNGIGSGQSVVSFTYSGSIIPSSYWASSTGTYNYITGSTTTSSSCPSCP